MRCPAAVKDEGTGLPSFDSDKSFDSFSADPTPRVQQFSLTKQDEDDEADCVILGSFSSSQSGLIRTRLTGLKGRKEIKQV